MRTVPMNPVHYWYNTAKNMFLAKTGMAGNYYDSWINGYHFIVLGSDAISGDKAIISTTQLNWFQQALSVNANPNKPIFVFVHQPLSNTVSGSDIIQDQQQDQQLKSILTQFPQVVLLTGHIHSVFTESTEFYNQQYCNMANVPATAYLWYDSGDGSVCHSFILLPNLRGKVINSPFRIPADVTLEKPRHPKSKRGTSIPGIAGKHLLLKEEILWIPFIKKYK